MAMIESESRQERTAQGERADTSAATEAEAGAAVGRRGRRVWLRWVPVALIAAGLIAALLAGIDGEAMLAYLEAHHAELSDWVEAHLVVAVLAYAAIYAVAIALSVPGGAVLTLVGGFLFGVWAGTAIVVGAATLGATGLFLAARAAVGRSLSRKAGPFVAKMEEGFKRDAFNYLLFLRLTPIFPFWIVNLVPALLHVPLGTYMLATLLGIIPGTFVFASFGAGIGHLLAAGADITLGDVLTLEVILGLTGLAALALVPVVFRSWRARMLRRSGGAPRR